MKEMERKVTTHEKSIDNIKARADTTEEEMGRIRESVEEIRQSATVGQTDEVHAKRDFEKAVKVEVRELMEQEKGRNRSSLVT